MRTWCTKEGLLQEIQNGSSKSKWAGSRHLRGPWKQVRGRTVTTKWLEKPKESKLAVQKNQKGKGGRTIVGSGWDLILTSGNGEIFRCNSEYTNSCARSNMALWSVAF